MVDTTGAPSRQPNNPVAPAFALGYPADMIDRAAHIRQESDRFAAVLAATDPNKAVPTCPGWTALDLLGHLTEVHLFWAAVIGRRLMGPQVGDYETNRPPLPTSVSELLAARAAATDDLLRALATRDPAEPAWSWFPPDQTVGFTWRMQTHEATIHRVDAELTAGVPVTPLPAPVAAEGIDHVLDVMWNWVPPDVERRATGVLSLYASDTGTSWPVGTYRWSGSAWGQDFVCAPGAGRGPAGAQHAGGADATVTGTTADLDLLLWGRAHPGTAIERTGDPQVLAELQAVLDQGIQ